MLFSNLFALNGRDSDNTFLERNLDSDVSIDTINIVVTSIVVAIGVLVAVFAWLMYCYYVELHDFNFPGYESYQYGATRRHSATNEGLALGQAASRYNIMVDEETGDIITHREDAPTTERAAAARDRTRRTSEAMLGVDSRRGSSWSLASGSHHQQHYQQPHGRRSSTFSVGPPLADRRASSGSLLAAYPSNTFNAADRRGSSSYYAPEQRRGSSYDTQRRRSQHFDTLDLDGYHYNLGPPGTERRRSVSFEDLPQMPERRSSRDLMLLAPRRSSRDLLPPEARRESLSNPMLPGYRRQSQIQIASVGERRRRATEQYLPPDRRGSMESLSYSRRERRGSARSISSRSRSGSTRSRHMSFDAAPPPVERRSSSHNLLLPPPAGRPRMPSPTNSDSRRSPDPLHMPDGSREYQDSPVSALTAESAASRSSPSMRPSLPAPAYDEHSMKSAQSPHLLRQPQRSLYQIGETPEPSDPDDEEEGKRLQRRRVTRDVQIENGQPSQPTASRESAAMTVPSARKYSTEVHIVESSDSDSDVVVNLPPAFQKDHHAGINEPPLDTRHDQPTDVAMESQLDKNQPLRPPPTHGPMMYIQMHDDAADGTAESTI
ncbi:uncharacterized protein MONBRDRAFT_8912 [Monosiga brevicollis MX1]|uniref:Uncharacterized protein n=1 Tax=Monosiga brevicollis TaxID=81824 RepID=A9V1H9_MONBE|nr:uncharacterized protein MONBRDRAFT_8912 [Monosiga brevicollis MX1]EDQ88569.1 predicted protein [Monosiga brevicollis MX1]|eukprot:XP_001746673.1 hypothetical protein [Monosiga brevicollis MX1]